MYPPRPNYAVWLIVLAIALVVCVAMYVQLERGLAANDASKVSLDLSAQVQVVQRLSDAEAQRVLVLANANRQNKEGEASLTESRGRARKHTRSRPRPSRSRGQSAMIATPRKSAMVA